MEPVEVVWEDPPEKKNPRGLAVEIARQLRTRPNVWAKVLGPTSSGKVESLRVMLTQGHHVVIQPGEFETRRKKTDLSDDQSICLWARYVGNGSETDD